MDTVVLMQKVRGALAGYSLIDLPGGLLVIAPDGSRAEIMARSVPIPVPDSIPPVAMPPVIVSAEAATQAAIAASLAELSALKKATK
jgi:hypothetical protein